MRETFKVMVLFLVVAYQNHMEWLAEVLLWKQHPKDNLVGLSKVCVVRHHLSLSNAMNTTRQYSNITICTWPYTLE